MRNTLLINWVNCTECGYETAAWDEVACPHCSCNMTPVAKAGVIFDNRNIEDKNV